MKKILGISALCTVWFVITTYLSGRLGGWLGKAIAEEMMREDDEESES